VSAVVCDASVIFKLVVAEEGSDQALHLAENYQIAVPEFLFLEIGNALWSRVRSGKSRAGDVPELLDDLDAFSFDIRSATLLVKPALSFAIRLDHPIYDCTYLALAERLGIPLITADQRFLGVWSRSKLQTIDVRALAAFG
jgi:predicted nucleic acid-binding protein